VRDDAKIARQSDRHESRTMRAHGYMVNPGSITALASRPCFASQRELFHRGSAFLHGIFRPRVERACEIGALPKKERSLDMTKAFALS
jgi:hypothetical protein